MISWLLTLDDAEFINGQLCYDVSMYEGESRQRMERIILDLQSLIDRKRIDIESFLQAARECGERGDQDVDIK